MKRIFVVSWFYPPINSSEGLVTFKLLNNSRYEYDVYTQKNTADWSYGKNVALRNRDNVRSIYAKSKYVIDWKEEAFRYFCAHRDEYDCIMTRSMPQESHEVGLRIKRAFPEITWIASFGDPVKNNPYQHIDCSLHSYHAMDNLINHDKGRRFICSPKRIAYSTYWRLRHKVAIQIRRKLAQIEDDTLLLADRIILNNESQKKYMLPPAVLSKGIVLPHSYDTTFYPPAEKQPHEKLRFLFLGHLDVIRTAYPLLQAIVELKKTVPDLEEHAEFLFYGEMADSDLIFLVKNGLSDLIHFRKPISYLESLRQMQQADWVMHIDGNISLVTDENIFFAAKIADYFGAGTPILAITMNKGAIADTLKNAGELVLSYSTAEIKQYLYLIIEKHWTAKPNQDYISRFDARNVAAEFDEKVIGAIYGTTD